MCISRSGVWFDAFSFNHQWFYWPAIRKTAGNPIVLYVMKADSSGFDSSTCLSGVTATATCSVSTESLSCSRITQLTTNSTHLQQRIYRILADRFSPDDPLPPSTNQHAHTKTMGSRRPWRQPIVNFQLKLQGLQGFSFVFIVSNISLVCSVGMV